MCAYLGVGPDEDPYVREVGQMALSAPVPDGWVEVTDESAPVPEGWVEVTDESGVSVFKNQDTGAVQMDHPLDPYFEELIRRRRHELDLKSEDVTEKSARALEHMTTVMTGSGRVPESGSGDVESATAALASINEGQAEEHENVKEKEEQRVQQEIEVAAAAAAAAVAAARSKEDGDQSAAEQRLKGEKEEEARVAEKAKAAEEARVAGEVTKAAEAAAAEEVRLSEEAKAAEEVRLAEESKVVEEARLLEEAKAAASAKAVEEARLAGEAKAAASAKAAAVAKAAEEARLAGEAKADAEARAAEEAKAAKEAQLVEEAKTAAEAKEAEEAHVAGEAKAAQDVKAAEEAQVAEVARVPSGAKAAGEVKAAKGAKAAGKTEVTKDAITAEGAKAAEKTEVAEDAGVAEESKAAEKTEVVEDAGVVEEGKAAEEHSEQVGEALLQEEEALHVENGHLSQMFDKAFRTAPDPTGQEEEQGSIEDANRASPADQDADQPSTADAAAVGSAVLEQNEKAEAPPDKVVADEETAGLSDTGGGIPVITFGSHVNEKRGNEGTGDESSLTHIEESPPPVADHGGVAEQDVSARATASKDVAELATVSTRDVAEPDLMESRVDADVAPLERPSTSRAAAPGAAESAQKVENVPEGSKPDSASEEAPQADQSEEVPPKEETSSSRRAPPPVVVPLPDIEGIASSKHGGEMKPMPPATSPLSSAESMNQKRKKDVVVMSRNASSDAAPDDDVLVAAQAVPAVGRRGSKIPSKENAPLEKPRGAAKAIETPKKKPMLPSIALEGAAQQHPAKGTPLRSKSQPKRRGDSSTGFPSSILPPISSSPHRAAGISGDPWAGVGALAVDQKPSHERIMVALRTRPLIQSADAFAWELDEVNNSIRMRSDMPRSVGAASRSFKFDHLFGPESSTAELFDKHVKPLLDSALQGINCTVFAYGQTGSGKSFTMFGPNSEDGTIGHALVHMYKGIGAKSSSSPGGARLDYSMKLSMMELYNEQLRDLLVTGIGNQADQDNHIGQTALSIADDPRLGTRVKGLLEVPIPSYHQAGMLVAYGASQRTIGSTTLNDVSSRSHTIVRINIETRDSSSNELLHTAIVNFVDLAGSERCGKTGTTGTRFQEGTNINLSLLMLGQVVARLAEGKKGDFIPYRNSKLTRLLQPCLGGSARTAVVAVISPSHNHIEETLNTLNFAQRSMAVINEVSVNRAPDPGGPMVGALKKQVLELKQQLLQAKAANVAQKQVPELKQQLLQAKAANVAQKQVPELKQLLLQAKAANVAQLSESHAATAQTRADEPRTPTAADHSYPAAVPLDVTGLPTSMPDSGVLRSIAFVACHPPHADEATPSDILVAVNNMRDECDYLRSSGGGDVEAIEELAAVEDEIHKFEYALSALNAAEAMAVAADRRSASTEALLDDMRKRNLKLHAAEAMAVAADRRSASTEALLDDMRKRNMKSGAGTVEPEDECDAVKKEHARYKLESSLLQGKATNGYGDEMRRLESDLEEATQIGSATAAGEEASNTVATAKQIEAATAAVEEASKAVAAVRGVVIARVSSPVSLPSQKSLEEVNVHRARAEVASKAAEKLQHNVGVLSHELQALTNERNTLLKMMLQRSNITSALPIPSLKAPDGASGNSYAPVVPQDNSSLGHAQQQTTGLQRQEPQAGSGHGGNDHHHHHHNRTTGTTEPKPHEANQPTNENKTETTGNTGHETERIFPSAHPGMGQGIMSPDADSFHHQQQQLAGGSAPGMHVWQPSLPTFEDGAIGV
eukprot:gene15868-21996_t